MLGSCLNNGISDLQSGRASPEIDLLLYIDLEEPRVVEIALESLGKYHESIYHEERILSGCNSVRMDFISSCGRRAPESLRGGAPGSLPSSDDWMDTRPHQRMESILPGGY